MVSAGKKAAITRALGGWTFEQHLDNRPEHIQAVLLGIQEFMQSLDPAHRIVSLLSPARSDGTARECADEPDRHQYVRRRPKKRR